MSQVDIVTRTRDRPYFLHRVLKSIAAQTYKDWHLILVDQGNSDVSRALLDSMEEFRGKYTLVPAPKTINIAAMCNLGIEAGTSEFINFLDDDDTWDPAYLATAVPVLQQRPHPRFGGVACQTTRIDEEMSADGEWVPVRKLPIPKFGHITVLDLLRRPVMHLSAFLYERRCHEVLGPWNEQPVSSEDWDFHRTFICKFDILVLGDYLTYYHKRPRAVGDAGNSTNVQGLAQYFYSSTMNHSMREAMEADPTQLGTITALAQLEVNLHKRLKHLEHHLTVLEATLDRISDKIGKIDARSRAIRDKVVRGKSTVSDG